MSKTEKIKVLVDDFISMFPDSSSQERKLLEMTLDFFPENELDLLLSGVENE